GGTDVINNEDSPLPPPIRGDGPSFNIPNGNPGGWTGGTFVPRDGGGSIETDSGSIPTRPLNDIMGGLQNIINDAGRGLGFNGRDGEFDVNQFADAITEVFMP